MRETMTLDNILLSTYKNGNDSTTASPLLQHILVSHCNTTHPHGSGSLGVQHHPRQKSREPFWQLWPFSGALKDCWTEYFYILFFLLCFSHYASPCYVYPPDVKDPCLDKQCSFGALCVPSLDGLTARCQCPERCDNYGDSVDSVPICGGDGKDYNNKCEMEKASCMDMVERSVKYSGRCGE